MNNSERDWQELTRRYYAGETSLEEEKALRLHWSENAPDSAETKMATYFEREASESSDIDWSELSAKLVAEDSSFRLPQVGDSRASGVGSPQKPRNLIYFKPRFLLAYAAALAAILAAVFLLPQHTETDSVASAEGFPITESVDWSRYEITDPEEAKTILQQSLQQVANPWNEATRASLNLKNIQLLNNPFGR
ncbi:MAG: hypothetical protein AAF741_10390 [Bacteroidota bacterium]